MDAILVINSGSSSLKASIYRRDGENILAHGLAEALESPQARLRIEQATPTGTESRELALPGADHSQALASMLDHLGGLARIAAVGHRVVHGGEAFSGSVLLEENTLAAIRDCIPLAPLHNPANLAGILAAQARFPDLPHVAVFDTAFHQSLPAHAFLYALPHEFYETYKVRRYGFHGTSHRYVAREAARRLGLDPADHGLLTAHLGNGCSACAVQNGLSRDTSMGFTPLEGLVMGTRCGDIDPNLHEFLAQRLGLSLAEITGILNRKSGLLGLSGRSNDMRTLARAAAEGDARAALAIEVFCYRLAKGLLALSAGLERLDALVFTGGIGENSAAIRAKTLGFLKILRPCLDAAANETNGRHHDGLISAPGSSPALLVIPTREEWQIARDTAEVLEAKSPTPPPAP